jgi:hypothetical protein
MTTYSLYGYWPGTLERFANTFDGDTVRDAETAAYKWAEAECADELRVCGLMEGIVPNVALHTLFINPDDERNIGADGIVFDTPGLQAVEYSVLGVVFDPENRDWNHDTGGERYLQRVMALSPAAAEDVARDVVADKHGDLWVCGVAEGWLTRADRYAPFVNPTYRAARRTA